MRLSGEVWGRGRGAEGIGLRAESLRGRSKFGEWWKIIFGVMIIWGGSPFFVQAQEVVFRDVQGWQIANADTFFVDQNANIFLHPSEGEYAFAFQSFSPPDFSRKYWVDADIWLNGQPEETDVYYLFSTTADSGKEPAFFVAGYSLAKKQMQFGKLQKDKKETFSLEIIESKPVEIRDDRYKYVFRIIFNDETSELIFEVNGVPMPMPALFPQNAVQRFGFLLRGNLVRIEPLRIDGR